MFELPRFVFKAGDLIVEQGEIRRVPFGPTLSANPAFDRGVVPHIREWFNEHYSLSFGNFALKLTFT